MTKHKYLFRGRFVRDRIELNILSEVSETTRLIDLLVCYFLTSELFFLERCNKCKRHII